MKKFTNRSLFNKNKIDNNYHLKQYNTPYESTKQLSRLLKSYAGIKERKLLDLGCGAGANTYYLKKKFDLSTATGVDMNSNLINSAKKIIKLKSVKNIDFLVDDIEKNKKLKKKRLKFGIVTLIQVLSVLDSYNKVLKSAISFKPKFIAVSSLFWDGDLDFKIKVNFLNKKNTKIEKTSVYNIYSLNKYLNFMKLNGYNKNIVKKLKITTNLKVRNKKYMGSYTANLNGKKTLITGPILQSWYFVISIKK
jgi:SAM-dependent methyltransferase